MGAKTGIEWTDSTWSPIRFRVKGDAAQIAREKGYASLVQIAEKMAGRVGQHCEHVSPGCLNCYAATNNHRCLPFNGTGLPYDRRSRDLVEPFIDEKVLLTPFKWGPVVDHLSGCGGVRSAGRRTCKCPTRPRRIFVENQSDLFGEWVTDEMLDRVFAVMALCPQHVFQALTKRPMRTQEYLKDRAWKIALVICELIEKGQVGAPEAIGYSDWLEEHYPDRDGFIRCWPLPNVWLGVSVENQAAVDERIPLLLKTPAAVRFISAEPLLGRLSIAKYLPNGLCDMHACRAASSAEGRPCGEHCVHNELPEAFLDWVICGGESGPHARPMYPDWAREVRDQCVAACVPFFFKQWGEWAETGGGPPHSVHVNEEPPIDSTNVVISLDGHVPRSLGEMSDGTRYRWMSRVGKHAAGALLDGVEYRAFPDAVTKALSVRAPEIEAALKDEED